METENYNYHMEAENDDYYMEVDKDNIVYPDLFTFYFTFKKKCRGLENKVVEIKTYILDDAIEEMEKRYSKLWDRYYISHLSKISSLSYSVCYDLHKDYIERTKSIDLSEYEIIGKYEVLVKSIEDTCTYNYCSFDYIIQGKYEVWFDSTESPSFQHFYNYRKFLVYNMTSCSPSYYDTSVYSAETAEKALSPLKLANNSGYYGEPILCDTKDSCMRVEKVSDTYTYYTKSSLEGGRLVGQTATFVAPSYQEIKLMIETF